MRKGWVAGSVTCACLLAVPAGARPVAINENVRIGPLGEAIVSVRRDAPAPGNEFRLGATEMPEDDKARLSMVVDGQSEVGFSLRRLRSAAGDRSASAVLGLWDDDGAIEFGAFQARPGATATAGASSLVRMVSGREARSRGVKLTGALHADDESGWQVALDARHQRLRDYVDTLRGLGGSVGESRLSLTGRWQF